MTSHSAYSHDSYAAKPTHLAWYGAPRRAQTVRADASSPRAGADTQRVPEQA